MKRWICAVSLLVTVGCSAVPSVPAHLQSQAAAIRMSGGAFGAAHSGNFTEGDCSPPGIYGHFSFSGTGSGDFIGRNLESGSMLGNVYQGCSWSGTTKLTSLAHPRNSLSMALSLSGGEPCPRFGGRTLFFTVMSGTGKFVHATGSGTVKLTCSFAKHTYTDEWSGTITF